MREPKTIRVKNGGSVSLKPGPHEKDWTLLEVVTADRTLALSVILTEDEAVALGRHLLRLAGGPEPSRRRARSGRSPATRVE